MFSRSPFLLYSSLVFGQYLFPTSTIQTDRRVCGKTYAHILLRCLAEMLKKYHSLFLLSSSWFCYISHWMGWTVFDSKFSGLSLIMNTAHPFFYYARCKAQIVKDDQSSSPKRRLRAAAMLPCSLSQLSTVTNRHVNRSLNHREVTNVSQI